VIDRLLTRLSWENEPSQGRTDLTGEQFSVADTYLFTVTGWARLVKLNLSGLQNIASFRQGMSARPGVQAAMKAEGLIA
jgi:glutathione S-transferase